MCWLFVDNLTFLINNSLKFQNPESPPVIEISGEVKLNQPITEKEGNSNFAEIRVSDNGIGFDEKYLDRIFQPFQRLHQQYEYEGTGMGLAICRKIVERHGGIITAESSPNLGATFIIRIPFHQTKGSDS